MWRSRRVHVVAACVLVVLVLGVLLVSRNPSKTQRVGVTDAATATTESTTTTTESSTTTTIEETTTTAVPATTTAAPAITATTRLAPPTTVLPAGNQPLTIKITASPNHVTVGETVTLTATLRDGDAEPRGGCVIWQYDDGYGPFYLSYGHGEPDGSPCVGYEPSCDGTPSPQGGSASDTVTFTLDGAAPSDHVTFTAIANSHEPSCRYDSKATASISVPITG